MSREQKVDDIRSINTESGKLGSWKIGNVNVNMKMNVDESKCVLLFILLTEIDHTRY